MTSAPVPALTRLNSLQRATSRQRLRTGRRASRFDRRKASTATAINVPAYSNTLVVLGTAGMSVAQDDIGRSIKQEREALRRQLKQID